MNEIPAKAYLKDLHLGKTQAYVDQYDASLLQAIPRDLSRESLQLPDNFYGEDIWTAYELSWLNPKGKPCVAIAEFSIPADSLAIVESKSFKYYLNSLNQSVFESGTHLSEYLVTDISNCVQAPIKAQVFLPDDYMRHHNIAFGGAIGLDFIDVDVSAYEPDAALLSPSDARFGHWYSHLLKSNCPVTGQPDWASIWIGMEGASLMAESLLRYIISFRQHQDFHENCVERIFSDILQVVEPTQLWVYARYTRRGGLDINPFRSLQPMQPPACVTARQ